MDKLIIIVVFYSLNRILCDHQILDAFFAEAAFFHRRLFLLVLDLVMGQINKTPRGIDWQFLQMTRLENLDFNDDICLICYIPHKG